MTVRRFDLNHAFGILGGVIGFFLACRVVAFAIQAIYFPI